MIFTDFEVLRIGETVVLSALCDGSTVTGYKLQVTMTCATQAMAELHEKMFHRLAKCATVYQEVPDDVLEATLILMKGKDT